MAASPTVFVRGEATVETQPELAALTITVEAQAGDRRAAMDLLSQRARAVSDVLSRFEVGIERSETSRLHVFPELESKRSERVRRYVGRSSTSLTVSDFAVLSDLLVAAVSIELVSIDGPWWRLRPTSAAYRRARLAAVQDAVARARDYAEAFGAEVLGLLEVADVGMSSGIARQGVMPVTFAAMGAARESGSARDLPLEPAPQEVVGQVEARFAISTPDLRRFGNHLA